VDRLAKLSNAMGTAGHRVASLANGKLAGPSLAGPSAPPALDAAKPPRRQRSKLWELSDSVHCSIIGTCLTTSELRRVMAKASADVSRVSDHDLHSRAVGLCCQHTAASKLLHKALDQRHETVVKRFARLQGEAAVLAAWAEARGMGDIPGAYWAALTHPDIGHTGLRQAFGDVHMLSHLVGAANRADIRRLTALEQENAALLAKVDRQQARLHEAVTSRDATIRRLSAFAARQAGRTAEPDDDDALAALRHLVADLQGRLARDAGQRGRLAQRVAEALEAGRLWERRAREAEAQHAAVQRELAALERQDAPGTATRSFPASNLPAANLPAQCILYVGGRPGCTEQMRASLEAAGGALLCHDGGRHDHPSLLAGLISQADRVAFPVDCVSHDAALTVKRLCRQLGKPWLPLRSSGLGSFLAALAEPAGEQPPHPPEHSNGVPP